MFFPVVVYRWERCTLKKSEHQRKDAFKLWCFWRLLRIPWTTRRSNQSILKEINPQYSLESLMLKLKLQYFDHLMGRADSLEKTLILQKDWGQEEKGIKRMKWSEGIIDSMDMNLSKLWQMVKDREAWHAAVRGVAKHWRRLSDWTSLKVTWPCALRSSVARILLGVGPVGQGIQASVNHWFELPWYSLWLRALPHLWVVPYTENK